MLKLASIPDTRVRDLSEDEVAKIRGVLDADYKVEGDLRREEALNIKHQVKSTPIEGKRHRMGLPLRGQRTKTECTYSQRSLEKQLLVKEIR